MIFNLYKSLMEIRGCLKLCGFPGVSYIPKYYKVKTVLLQLTSTVSLVYRNIGIMREIIFFCLFLFVFFSFKFTLTNMKSLNWWTGIKISPGSGNDHGKHVSLHKAAEVVRWPTDWLFIIYKVDIIILISFSDLAHSSFCSPASPLRIGSYPIKPFSIL